jgi:hypothetical protein
MSGEAVKIAIRVRPFIKEPDQTCCIKMVAHVHLHIFLD